MISRNNFTIRDNGIMQFPVGQYLVSIGIGPSHYGNQEDGTVEIAVFDGEDRFVTRGVFGNVFGEKIDDDVAVINAEEFRRILEYLSS
ncbi:MAG: hypothetical protein ACO3QV_07135 [Candidatus Nanopelagicaceae bacterium]|jgi:hypothetical protein